MQDWQKTIHVAKLEQECFLWQLVGLYNCTLPQAEESEKSEESEEEHEETEEEFLERYAKTARELQEEAVEEAENGQDEDGHEIELGTSPHILLKLSCCYFLSLSPSFFCTMLFSSS